MPDGPPRRRRPPPTPPPPLEDPAARRRLLVEVLAVTGGALALAGGVLALGRAVPLVARNAQVLVAAVFLLIPTRWLVWRGADLDAYGLTYRPTGRGLALYLAAVAVTFPPFVLGFIRYYRLVCGPHAPPLATRIYAGVCPRFAGSLAAARWRAPARPFRFVLSQLIVVALPEEYFFRGYVQTSLERVWPPRRRVLGGGLGRALLLATLLFAAGHLLVAIDPLRLATFFPGLVFGWLRGAGGSVLPGVLYHASCNILSHVLHRTFFR